MSLVNTKSVILSLNGSPIGRVVSISGPSRSFETIDVTELADDDRSFLPGVSDPGELTFTIHYDPANSSHTALETQWDHQKDPDSTAQVGTFEVDFGSKVIGGDGILTALPFNSMEVNGVVSCDITVKCSGEWSVGAGGS